MRAFIAAADELRIDQCHSAVPLHGIPVSMPFCQLLPRPRISVSSAH
jgi:hypothetical protein